MNGIIVAFAKRNNAEHIRDIIRGHGFEVRGVHTTVSGVLSTTQNMSGGIIICGLHLKDMHCSELVNFIPKGFRIIVIAKQSQFDECPDGVDFIETPLTVNALIEGIKAVESGESLLEIRRKSKKKAQPIPEAEKELILKAKNILMATLNMTEQEAHRYIQKKSMDHKRTKLDTAKLIIRTMGTVKQ